MPTPPAGTLVGMVHVGPLPGSPQYGGDMEPLLDDAVADAETLAAAGFDALVVENFGDAPFFADDVPKETIAAITRVVGRIVDAVPIPVGVNVLRNDALGGLAVAAATGAGFIRVNVLSGSMYTDQGLIEGKAAVVARTRATLCPEVAIYADVMVKHAVPPSGLTLEQAAQETAGRGGADAVIVSGRATGSAPTLTDLRKVRAAIPNTPLIVGSGATAATVAKFLTVADGVIAGTSLKRRSVTTNPVQASRAKAFVQAAKKGRRR